MIKSFLYILLFGFCFLSFTLIAKEPVGMLQITVEDGLSNNSINCIYQDSYGFLWVGTSDGLNRFDGYKFVIYKYHHNVKNSLTNNFITAISEDEKGNMWIGTENGLNKYLRKRNLFEHFDSYYDSLNSISSNRIQALFCDQSNGVWVKTDLGLDKLNIKTGRVSNFSFYNNVFNTFDLHYSSSIFVDNKGNLWIGTKDGLNLFNYNLEVFERYSNSFNDFSISDNNVLKIYQDRLGELWVGTANGLNLFDPEKKIFTHFFPDKNHHNIFVNSIFEIIEDNDGNLLIGTGKGLYVFDKREHELVPASKYFNSDKFSLLENAPIKSIKVDNSNIIWIGTSNYGIFKYDKKGQKLNLYCWDENSKPIFLNNNVRSVFLDKNNVLWVGTKGEGLTLLDRDNNSINRLNTVKNVNLLSDEITRITPDTWGNLWIGTSKGVNLLEIKSKNNIGIYNFNVSKNIDNIGKKYIYSIIETRNKEIWIGTGKGLHIYRKGIVNSYYHDINDKKSLFSDVVYSLLQDSVNNIWIGTSSGLNVFSYFNSKIKRFKSNNKDFSLENKAIYEIFQSGNGDIWIGSIEGLYRYSKFKKQIVNKFTQKDGLPSNIILQIEEDNSGDLWLGTYNGLVKFNIQQNKIIPFDKSDGIQSYEYNLGASYKSDKGEMFFGGISGLNYFFPDSISYNTNIPNIVFTSFEVYDNKGPRQVPVKGKDTVYIPFEKNHFTIEFSVLEFTHSERCNYAYKMEGIDDEWIYSGNVRKATFSNISPGEYIFRIKGSNNDNIWNEKGSYVNIIIEAPFYRSKTAWIIYLFLFLLLVFLFFQYRTKNLRESNKALKDKEIVSKQIEQQREELIQKNKSITDSINYAKMIQEAIMPSEKYFGSILSHSFILYMPKDIVSGDFFWINKTVEKIFIAVVDCTGHGIPGAFMSLIGHELLRNITLVQGIEDPSLILNKLNFSLSEAFRKENNDYLLRDGMDISLCIIDKEKNNLEFAGAYNPIYIVKENKIVELKADRYTVGLITDETQSFTKYVIPLDSIDMIYMFTDGYTDQFGGPEEKKFKFRRFRHLLLTIHKLTLNKQKLFLKESIEKWKGDLEQVDDILLVGFNPHL